ncbi:hypothetical protein HUE56_23135 (plasmid) [Azospirillum oryzae]|uniref:Uncharacterized protein n=1 Tax=Azospirillum oryzae TaxID=286727 RepID=A0A6N1ANN8_9PROT|nr:hypothetical protein [Azospirillum oryzae]KAA0585048.1 hypothetical protein FZ938_27310 [Azospirillum oryzae]QKS53416.1 hypothetical protein HUE56_23135 [Azospirillum oryzae]GLR82518.1 hypothetical protein GCM10007856_52170 [Azospirillum oryzae]
MKFSKAIRNKPFGKADPLEQKIHAHSDYTVIKTEAAVRLAKAALHGGLAVGLPENGGVKLEKIDYTGGAAGFAGVSPKKVSGDVMKQLFQSKFKNTVNEAKQIGEKRREQLASITDSQMVTLKLR